MTIKISEAKLTFEVSDFEAESVNAAYDLLHEIEELVEDFFDKIEYKNIWLNRDDLIFSCDPVPEDSGPEIFKIERKNILESLNLFGVKK